MGLDSKLANLYRSADKDPQNIFLLQEIFWHEKKTGDPQRIHDYIVFVKEQIQKSKTEDRIPFLPLLKEIATNLFEQNHSVCEIYTISLPNSKIRVAKFHNSGNNSYIDSRTTAWFKKRLYKWDKNCNRLWKSVSLL